MIVLDGRSLTVEDVVAVAHGEAPVAIGARAMERMVASRRFVEEAMQGAAPVYALNTGVGLLANIRLEPDEIERMQVNLVRSHCCGVGEPLPANVVRGMMLIRANVLAKGLSGIRPVVAERICDLLNHGITPVIPSRGSVGASGDLAPLAHMALVLIGEGFAEYEGETLPAEECLRRARLGALKLEAKEGISLLNGTQAMLSMGCLLLARMEALFYTAQTAAAFSMEALRGTPAAFDARIHAARPHAGQMLSAGHLMELLEGSRIPRSHGEGVARIQDAYCLRCVPQVHGAYWETVAEARRVFEVELNSATDNPLVFCKDLGEPTHRGGAAMNGAHKREADPPPSAKDDKANSAIVSGGNFHGAPLALQLDYLAIAIYQIAGISERRTERLLNPALNEGLPAFLAARPGIESGLMMAQVTAAALVAEIRVLATPASIGSIPTSGNQEDFVSMGMTSALKLGKTVELAEMVVGIEAMAATRGLDLRGDRTTAVLEEAKARFREWVPGWEGDCVLSVPMAKAAEFVRSGGFGGAVVAGTPTHRDTAAMNGAPRMSGSQSEPTSQSRDVGHPDSSRYVEVGR
jgi:histidine ammonia-lyase